MEESEHNGVWGGEAAVTYHTVSVWYSQCFSPSERTSPSDMPNRPDCTAMEETPAQHALLCITGAQACTEV